MGRADSVAPRAGPVDIAMNVVAFVEAVQAGFVTLPGIKGPVGTLDLGAAGGGHLRVLVAAEGLAPLRDAIQSIIDGIEAKGEPERESGLVVAGPADVAQAVAVHDAVTKPPSS